MIGRDRNTGLPISGIAHLIQSCGDILSTRIGSRVMLPEYGSKIPDYVDMPVTEGWKGSVQAEAVRALKVWEPRLKLERVVVVSVLNGKIGLRLVGEYLGQAVDEITEVPT